MWGLLLPLQTFRWLRSLLNPHRPQSEDIIAIFIKADYQNFTHSYPPTQALTEGCHFYRHLDDEWAQDRSIAIAPPYHFHTPCIVIWVPQLKHPLFLTPTAHRCSFPLLDLQGWVLLAAAGCPTEPKMRLAAVLLSQIAPISMKIVLNSCFPLTFNFTVIWSGSWQTTAWVCFALPSKTNIWQEQKSLACSRCFKLGRCGPLFTCLEYENNSQISAARVKISLQLCLSASGVGGREAAEAAVLQRGPMPPIYTQTPLKLLIMGAGLLQTEKAGIDWGY